jgi:hypothetical protein
VYALILNGEVGIAQSFGLVLLYFLYVLVVGLGRVIYKCEQIATLRLNVCDPIVMCNLAFPSLASHPQPHRTHSPHSNSCSNNSSTTHHSPLCTLPSPLTTRTHTLLLPHHVIFRPPFVSVCSPLFPRACVRACVQALTHCLYGFRVFTTLPSRVCACVRCGRSDFFQRNDPLRPSMSMEETTPLFSSKQRAHVVSPDFHKDNPVCVNRWLPV